MVSAVESSVTIGAYKYDAQGLRIQKTADSTTTDYLYDGMQCVEERVSDSMTKQYVFGLYIDEVLQVMAGTTAYYPLQDLLYRTNKLTTDASVIYETYDTDAYGNTLIFNASSQQISSPTCEFIFTGRRFDSETGLYFYRARYYSPELGRFLSKDPLDYIDSMGLYEYCGSIPTLLTDALGKKSQISIDGCDITVTVKIILYADDATTNRIKNLRGGGLQGLLNTIKSGIESEWNKNSPSTTAGCDEVGVGGGCYVNVNVDVSFDDNAKHHWDIKVPGANTIRLSTTLLGNLSWVLYPGSSYGQWNPNAVDPAEYAHEAGHLMGLGETNWLGIHLLGYDPNSIMGEPFNGSGPSQSEINGIIGDKECPEECCCPPEYA